MRRSLTVALPVLISCFFSISCKHRVVVTGDEAGPSKDALDTSMCQQHPGALTVWDDPRGNATLAVSGAAILHEIQWDNASPKESAVTIDQGQVAAAVVTRSVNGDPPTELAQIFSAFGQRLSQKGAQLTVRTSGILGQSAQGFADVKEAIWDVSAPGGAYPQELRDLFLTSVLGLPQHTVIGTPPLRGSASSQLVVKVTAVAGPQRLGISVAAAHRWHVDGTKTDQGEETAASQVLDDLGNGTALFLGSATTEVNCDVAALEGRPMADIIWVIDDSGSMADNRKDIVRHANGFFAEAAAAGLDFRMGVTGVKAPAEDVIPGKFCSLSTTDFLDNGGEDRFLLPNEQALFSDCVLNPPFFEEEHEYGLTNAFWAVQRHLPRATGSPQKIREGAHLAIIFVSDEAPMELKVDGSFEGVEGFLTEKHLAGDCELEAEDQAQVGRGIAPLQELLEGRTVVGAQATVHLIGGVCGNRCSADIAHGYRELTQALGGQQGDVCQDDLSATLRVIVDSISAAASPRVLQAVPISATLQVEANGQPVPRSRTNGFLYNAPSNSLTFFNLDVGPGDQVVALYQQFVPKN